MQEETPTQGPRTRTAWVLADLQADADAALLALSPDFRVERLAITQALLASTDDAELPDLLVLDQRQTSDSVALLTSLRARWSAATLPIIVIVEAGAPLDLLAAIDAGASDCIDRPYAPAELRARARHRARWSRSGPLSASWPEPRRLEQLTFELQRSEERFRTLADNAPDLIDRFDREHRHSFVNQAVTRMTGIPVERYIGSTNAELGLPDELVRRIDSHVGQVFASGTPSTMEFEFESTAGPVFLETRFVPELDRHGRVESVLAISRDMTERIRAEQALEDSERLFRATFDAAAVGIGHVDFAGRWLRTNERLREITGYSAEELHARTFRDITHPDDLAADLANIELLLEGRISSYRMEKRYIRKDGSIVWINLSVSLLRSPTGEPRHFISVIEDITSRKQVEQALRESDRQKDWFLAVLGHELRNPIAAIRTASEWLRAIDSADERLRRVHGVLDRQTSHVARLLDDLLDISRITRGKLTLSRSTIDLVEIVRHVVEDRRGQLIERGLQLRLALAESPAWIEGDAVRLAQVSDNLIGNAIKYTEAPGLMAVSVAREGDHAVLRVLDSGVGLEPEFRSRLFQPFHQAPQDIARSAGGLGLGLAISKGIVDLHGGTIEAHSRGRDQGTEFVVRLPCRSDLPLASPANEAARPGKWRVLVVEDNEDLLQMLAELLGQGGHEVTLARSGHEALGLAARMRPDVILCDIGLPDMSGYEVARAIRADDRLRTTRLIAISGYGQPEDRRRSIEAGFSAHLTKPVTIDALEQLIAPSP